MFRFDLFVRNIGFLDLTFLPFLLTIAPSRYVIISREIFNPNYALFKSSPGDRVSF